LHFLEVGRRSSATHARPPAAQRSSQAAKDIKDLITNSSTQVQEGVELVNRAGASLTEIVDSIKRVSEIVSEIALASSEQSTGINQVNDALTQMDDMTQQNAALVEENAAAAKVLEQRSQEMTDSVAFFRLEDAASEDATVVDFKPAAPAAPERTTMMPHQRATAAAGGR
jgi:uncharacterized phage infection (PIP) family protein YhgE